MWLLPPPKSPISSVAVSLVNWQMHALLPKPCVSKLRTDRRCLLMRLTQSLPWWALA